MACPFSLNVSVEFSASFGSKLLRKHVYISQVNWSLPKTKQTNKPSNKRDEERKKLNEKMWKKGADERKPSQKPYCHKQMKRNEPPTNYCKIFVMRFTRLEQAIMFCSRKRRKKIHLYNFLHSSIAFCCTLKGPSHLP